MATAPESTIVAKSKTVLDDMPSPRFFPNVEEAANYLNQCDESYSDFESVPKIGNGIDWDTGEFDPAVYSDDSRVMVAVLTNRGTKQADGTTGPSTVRCIVITPVPTLDALLASESGVAWLSKVINTQLNHTAVAPLRKAENLTLAAKEMPLSLEDFVTTSRESSSVTETFDKLFRGILDSFKAKSPAWAKARLIKAELKKAMESAAYASSVYAPLEDRGEKPSLFVMAIQVGIREAKAQGLDPTIFETWLATRNEKTIADAEAEEEEDFDLDDIVLAAPIEEAAPAPTPTEEAPAEVVTA
jgi:hypothetical protein